MSVGARRLLWLVIGVGIAARLVVAFATVGHAYDIESLRLVGSTFDDHPLHVYGLVSTGERAGIFILYTWPYPPGYMPLATAAVGLAKALGIPFHGVIQLFPIAAEAAIAWLVQDFLGRRGATERVRIAAAALVALGPCFMVVSGYHGQIDPVAVLPAVAALWLWETRPSARRALWAGLLIGLGASVKTVPAVMLLALLPSSRDLREGATLAAAAAAVPLAMTAPFLAADGANVLEALRYVGAPGLGGISMFVDPGLVRAFLTEDFPVSLGDATETLYDNAGVVVALALAAAAAFLLRHRAGAIQASVFVWLVVYAFNPNWFPQYMVWGLPFFLMAGHLGKVALVQAALVPVLVLFYLRPWETDAVAALYFAIMLGLWVAWVVCLVLAGSRISRERRARTTPAPGTP